MRDFTARSYRKPLALACALIVTLFTIQAQAITVPFTGRLNPDGAISTAFPCLDTVGRTDCAPPTTANLAWGTVANQSVLSGSSYSVNLRTLYLTGANASGATITIIGASDTSACSLPSGWSATANGLSYTGTGTGTITCRAKAVSTDTTISNVFTVASSAPAGADTTAPTQGLIESIALNGSNKPVLTILPGCDVENSGSSGLASYKVYRDGVALSPTSVTAPIQSAYTSTDIGTLSPVGTSTQSNGRDWLDIAEGQLNSTVGNDEFRFSYRSVTGDFISTAKIESFANVVSTLARGGLIARENTGAQDAYVTAQALANGTVRLQYRAVGAGTRTATGTGTLTYPGWIQLERSGSLFTVRLSADGNTWTDVSSLTQAMSQTLLVGRHTASQSDGNAVSVQSRQLCVTTLSRQTYTDSAASAGATHSYTVSWLDASANEGTQSASASIDVPPAPVTNAIKWHPGHYKFNSTQQAANNTVSTTFYTDLSNEPSAIKGIMQPYYWAALEPTTAGVYDWSKLDSKLSLLKSMGKRMIVYMRTRSCCSSSTGATNYLPTYIINGAQYGTSPYSYGTTSKIWETATMDRIIALYQAIAARYDSEPAFEGIATDETAINLPAGVTRSDVEAQYERLIAAWHAAAPHTQIWVFGNYMTSSPDGTLLKKLYTASSAAQAGVGGPDSPPQRAIEGFSIVQGALPTSGGHDFRDEADQLYISMSYLPYYPGDTATTVYNFVKNTLHGQYMAWKVHTDGTSAQNWTTGVIPLIQANPTTLTTCPTSFAACDTSN